MFPRRYLQNCLVSCSILVVAFSVSATADEEDDVNALFSFSSQPHPTGNETNYIGKYSDGYAPDASSNEIYNGGKVGATPALSALFPTGILSGDSMGTEAKPVVTITPSPASVPSMIITASKVTLGHRSLPVDSSNEVNSSSTITNLIAPLSQDDSSSASSSSSAQINISGGDGGEEASKNQRQSRYQRLPDNVSMESVTEPTFTRNDLQEQTPEYYKELEGEGGNSYGDNYLEENDPPEQLPTPMALINPNGEGNNPPLEEDFAEAFKKGNPNGKRRRFRGSRKNRMKLKKLTEDETPSTATDSNQTGPSSPAASQQEQTGIPTPSPLASTPKFKRVRSTTPTSMYTRAPVTTESSVMESSIQPSPPPPTTSTTMSQQPEEQDTGSSISIVRNGPKPIILQSMSNSDSAGVTQSPQIEKPSANTEKISTYFFSTPAPSARLRLRQNMRQTQPSTTTTTEAPAEDTTMDEDIWKDEFKDFHKTSFFSGPAAKEEYKIPSFVPMNLGLESDDRQDPVENSLTRPDTQLENKAYSIIRHGSDVGIHHRDYESYSGSSSTPKSRKVKRPTSTTYDYDTHSHISPTTETEKVVSSEYYNAQGSNTEPSTTFPTSLRAPTTAGSHYDRTKDRVIFYNDSPYSAHHGSVTTTAILGEFTVSPESSPGSSQTVGTHFAVAEAPGSHDIPLSSTEHYQHNPHHLNMYTRGQVYPPDDTPSQQESTFRNGPPDSSHIHSPNMVEHSTLASLNQHESQYHLPPHHNPYAQQHAYIESPHPSAQRPGGAIYGTVEEVPAHGENPYEHHSQHQLQANNGPIPYPYGAEHHPDSYPHAHAMQYPPHFPPSGAQSLPSQPPMLPPEPSHHPPSHYYSPQQHQEISNFSPSPYDIHADVSQQSSHEAQFSPNPNHLAESPSNPNIETPPAHLSASSQESLQQAPEQPSDVISPSQEAHFENTNSVGNDGSSGQDQQQQLYGGQQQQEQQMENEFPPHAHTMAVHPDYEPANPPLPHDHPFHNTFIPFPTQDGQGDLSAGTPEQDHDHLPNSISELGGGPFHPGTVENVPTGSPPFEPSPQIPVAKPPTANGIEFTPIPDDVKENDLFHSYANKPPPPPQYENAPSGPHHGIHEHNIPPHMYGTLDNPTGNEQQHQHQQEHSIHMNDPSLGYIGPTGHGQQNYNPYGPSGSEHGKEPGYSGPVTEIHSGPYQQPPNIQGQSYQHHEQPNNIHFPPDIPDMQHVPEHFKLGELRPEFKPNELGQDRPPPEAQPQEGNIHGPGPQQRPPGSIGQDGKPPHGAFSNTPYVLMFPQLIPEEQMRPSPPTLLSKEIPVVQASSMADFTSVSGEKPPLGPGLQAVRVHPRDQMYQVLAKAHYDKMMDKYMESKKRAPSAIYTPYGILVPVGTNVEAATSMPSHNPFPKQRPPPKFRGEKSLLSALLGSPSNTNGRFQHPNMGNRLNKIMEYEPAIDLLAEKLAMKLVAAQQTVPDKSNLGNMVAHLGHELMMAEKIDEGHHPFDHSHSQNPHIPGMHNRMMEGHPPRRPSPELKDYLKGVLKGQFHEIVDRAPGGSIEEHRRPMSLSAKLINSIFRKGRLNFPPPKSFLPIPGASMMMPTHAPNYSPSPPPSPNMLSNGGNIMPGSGPTIISHIRGNMIPKFSSGSMIPSFGGGSFMPSLGGMMTSASNVVTSKVPPPPGIKSKSSSAPTPAPARHSSHYHGGIGHPFPPIFPQGAAGLLGSIKRFFSFGQPGHFDGSLGPIFGGRTLFTGGSNSTRLPFLDGPSPRSSFQQKFSQQQQQPPPPPPPHHHLSNIIQQKFPIMVQQQQSPQQHQQPPQPHQQPPQQHQQPPQQHHLSLLRKMISMTASLPPMHPPPFHNFNFNNHHNNNNNINSNNIHNHNNSKNINHNNINNNNGNSSINSNNINTMTPPAPKPMKKPRKKSEKKPTKPGTEDGSSKMQNNRLNSSPHQQQMQTPPPPSSTTTSNPKLNPSTLINKTVISKPNATTSSGKSPPASSKASNSKNPGKDRHPFPQSRGEPTSSDKYQLVITKKVDPPIKKRKGSVAAQNATSSPSSTPSPPSSSSTPSPTPPKSSKLSKLDMFQTLLGSTRSVLNYFKSEARKSSPTVLKPRSAIATNEETSSYS